MHISVLNKLKALELRAQIYAYLVDNPGSQPKHIKAQFSINSSTAWKHMQAIRDGWRPEDA